MKTQSAETTGDVCPKCGADRRSDEDDQLFICGSFDGGFESLDRHYDFIQHDRCRILELERTVAELLAELDATRKRLAELTAERDRAAKVLEQGYNYFIGGDSLFAYRDEGGRTYWKFYHGDGTEYLTVMDAMWATANNS